MRASICRKSETNCPSFTARHFFSCVFISVDTFPSPGQNVEMGYEAHIPHCPVLQQFVFKHNQCRRVHLDWNQDFSQTNLILDPDSSKGYKPRKMRSCVWVFSWHHTWQSHEERTVGSFHGGNLEAVDTISNGCNQSSCLLTRCRPDGHYNSHQPSFFQISLLLRKLQMKSCTQIIKL